MPLVQFGPRQCLLPQGARSEHIDVMIGSTELDVDGVTANGERVPVLRNLTWHI